MAITGIGNTILNQVTPPFCLDDNLFDGQYLVYDQDLRAFVNESAPETTEVRFDNYSSADGVVNGTTMEFTLSDTPMNEQSVFIFINGVKQHTNAYTIDGDVVTLSEVPDVDDEIEIIYVVQLALNGLTVDFNNDVGDGVQDTFELSFFPLNKSAVIITINGVKQHINAYEFDGQNNNIVVFDEAPEDGDEIEFLGFTDTRTPLYISIFDNQLNPVNTLPQVDGGDLVSAYINNLVFRSDLDGLTPLDPDDTIVDNAEVILENGRAVVIIDSGLYNIIEDDTPKLGADLDVNAFEIIGSIDLVPGLNGSNLNGEIVLSPDYDGSVFPSIPDRHVRINGSLYVNNEIQSIGSGADSNLVLRASDSDSFVVVQDNLEVQSSVNITSMPETLSDYTVLSDDTVVLVQGPLTIGVPRVITLPANPSHGRIVIVKDISGDVDVSDPDPTLQFTIRIEGSPGQQIDEISTFDVIQTRYGKVKYIFDSNYDSWWSI